MERTITLQISEHIYKLIEKQAKARGAEPAQIVMEWVNKVLQQTQPPDYTTLIQTSTPTDPLKALFGTLKCDVVGVAERRDEYL